MRRLRAGNPAGDNESPRRRARRLGAGGCLGVLVLACTSATAFGALPSIDVEATTAPLANIGQHRGVTVTATCPAGARLVGGGSWLRQAADPSVLPTNGLVLGGSVASTGAAPVDGAAAGGTLDPASWMTIANYTGVSEAGNQASTYALCARSGGPAHVVIATASTTGTVAAQEVDPPHLATATCAPGTRLVGGGATTRTPDEVDDGTTVGNSGNLKPLGSYPSDAAGVPATDGSSAADSWSAFGSAGITSATDTATAYALCSTDPSIPAVQIVRADVDGPDAQPGTTPIVATASCPAATRLLGGGYRVDETVGTTSGLQPQQGYHMRGTHPGGALAPAADGDANPSSWTAYVQAGGQGLATGRHMTDHAFAMCATPPPAPDSADLAVQIAAAPDPVLVGGELTYTLTVSNAGPSIATDVVLAQGLPAAVDFTSASSPAGTCGYDTGTVTCMLGTISGGASATVTVKVAVTAAATLSSDATVRSAVDDPDPTDDAATATTHANLPQRAVPGLTAQTPAQAVLGAPIADSATLTGGDAPTGTIRFDLFGPGDDGCATPIATSSAAVGGSAALASAPHVTSATGTYRWIATYSGDGANEGAATSCADAAQAVSVKAAPTLAVRASADTTIGATISATATLSGATLATGALTFRLYGPGDDGCATPIASSSTPVSGNGIYGSPAVTASAPGTYRWVVAYDGDDSNRAAEATPCTAPGAAVVVTAATPPPGPPPPPPVVMAAVPSNAFAAVGRSIDARGRFRLRLRSPGSGRFGATATARRGRVTLRYGSASATVHGARTITLTVAPGPLARRELLRHSLRVALVVSFRPAGGALRKRRSTITVRRVHAS